MAFGALVAAATPALAGKVGASAAVRPRAVPNLPPNPDFLKTCVENSDTTTCDTKVLAAIANARKIEGLEPLTINHVDFLKLTLNERILAVTDLERTARHIAPIAGITKQLNAFAYTAALAGRDPSIPVALKLPGGGEVVGYGGNFAIGLVNALGSDYGWMYWDGPNSPNGGCPTAGAPGCYGHRHNILRNWDTTGGCAPGQVNRMYMGAGDNIKGVLDGGNTIKPSLTELFVHSCGAAPTDVVASWTQVEKILGI